VTQHGLVTTPYECRHQGAANGNGAANGKGERLQEGREIDGMGERIRGDGGEMERKKE
jgi:hypothetical protein